MSELLNCNGGDTTLTIAATGGIEAYEYSLNGGTFQSGNSFVVGAGNYATRVRLVTNTSCISTAANVVLTQPTTLKANAIFLAIDECGGNTKVAVSATGGSLPYSGIGTFTKGPGTFNFVVTDAKGCISNAFVTILPPGCVELEVFPNPATNQIRVNHSEAESNAILQIFSSKAGLAINQKVPKGSFISTIDIIKLASATYFLRYINGKTTKEIKFIKTH